MATDKQREAARRNGAKSNGPKTEAGKAKSARNSTKHGLTSNHPFLFTNEREEYYQEILAGYEATFQPANQAESDLVKTIALEQFRIERWRAIETAAIDVEMDRQRATITQEFLSIDEATRQSMAFVQLADNSPALALINRYLSSARRAHERAMRLLLELQNRRRKQPNDLNTPNVPAIGSAEGTASLSATDTAEGTASLSESDLQNSQNEPKIEQVPSNQVRFERRQPIEIRPAMHHLTAAS